ncbi:MULTISPECIES: hypothetical protein [unclassified Streptomyces]|uniref:hypothetical protein n=1 Tax=unclassified Streptomyces TaxID=2593676 RepID=UPI00364FA936
MSFTAAEAAEKALNWAEAAEVALGQVEEFRMMARRSEGARASAAALQERVMADDFELHRERAVGMANMWARVASALQATESGGLA